MSFLKWARDKTVYYRGVAKVRLARSCRCVRRKNLVCTLHRSFFDNKVRWGNLGIDCHWLIFGSAWRGSLPASRRPAPFTKKVHKTKAFPAQVHLRIYLRPPTTPSCWSCISFHHPRHLPTANSSQPPGSYHQHVVTGTGEGFAFGVPSQQLGGRGSGRYVHILLRTEGSSGTVKPWDCGEHCARGSTRCIPEQLYLPRPAGGSHQSFQHRAIIPSLSCICHGLTRPATLYLCCFVRHKHG